MSIKSRARHLSQATGTTYQQAHQAILMLGSRSSELAAKNNWPLKRADVFLIEPDADEEYAAASDGARHVGEQSCENCMATFFVGYDKKGYTDDSEELCAACREEHGVDECPRCGTEMLGEADGPCDSCMDQLMSED